ncbi:hypothetical protein ACN28T_38435 [Melittangium boletus]
MTLCCTAVMLALLVGCGTASRVVRLDTGETDPLVFNPSSSAKPVALGSGEFEKAVSELARDVRPATRPQDAARRLLELGARSGSYTYDTPSRRITPLTPGDHLEGQHTPEVVRGRCFYPGPIAKMPRTRSTNAGRTWDWTTVLSYQRV